VNAWPPPAWPRNELTTNVARSRSIVCTIRQVETKLPVWLLASLLSLLINCQVSREIDATARPAIQFHKQQRRTTMVWLLSNTHVDSTEPCAFIGVGSGSVAVGRNPTTCHVILAHASISRTHARLSVGPAPECQLFITDLSSTGTVSCLLAARFRLFVSTRSS
jgi:hypothetical protein